MKTKIIENIIRNEPNLFIKYLKIVPESLRKQVFYSKLNEGRYASQFLYRLYLEKYGQEVSRREGLDLAEAALKNDMGDELFDYFSKILEEQRKEKILELQKNKPEYLWHTTTAKVDKLEPRKNLTMYEEYEGDFVFATSSELEALAYVMHGATNLYMAGYAPGKKLCVLKDREEFLNYRERNPCFTYALRSDTFKPVVSKEGRFGNEWISEHEVEINQTKSHSLGIDDVMKSGAQVFFANNPEEYDKIIKDIGKLQYGDQKLRQLSVLATKGTVKHENLDKNICLIEYATRKTSDIER